MVNRLIIEYGVYEYNNLNIKFLDIVIFFVSWLGVKFCIFFVSCNKMFWNFI